MIRGGCLCGGVRYEVHGTISTASNCHCSRCRKAHGAAFATYAPVKMNDFVMVAGSGDIAAYESSPGVTRTFCKRCGSTLQFLSAKWPMSFGLALGTLDDDPGVRPSRHIFVGSKAPWFEITDRLPQHNDYA